MVGDMRLGFIDVWGIGRFCEKCEVCFVVLGVGLDGEIVVKT